MKIKPNIFLAIGVCLLAGLIGSIFTYQAIPTWYKELVKPSFTPPNWLFGPVWTTLYILMGISLFLVWKKGVKKKKKFALQLFFVQLGLNAVWSILFFGLQNPWLGVICILFLWTTILLTIREFYKIVPTASYLLIPYLAWVTVASFLNLSIALLN